MAAASCVNTGDDVMKSMIAVVVPGTGVATCQAAADNTAHEKSDARVSRASRRAPIRERSSSS